MSPTEAIVELYRWKPDTVSAKAASRVTGGAYYEESDEKAPLLSEAFLYNLLGKEDARTFMALLRSAFESVGVDPRRAENSRAKAVEEK
nr:hypothetical protein [Ferrimicrobium acidiphilum]